MQPRLTCSALVLLVALAVPAWTAAAPARQLSAELTNASPAQPSTQVWAWLTGLWAAVGCTIDPGGCAPAVDQGEIGCSIDPSGCAAALDHGDVGCSIDPDGCSR